MTNCRAHTPDDGRLCARPAGHPDVMHLYLNQLGNAAQVAHGMGLATPTTVIHVRGFGPLPALGTAGPVYLGRPMPRHPDPRVRAGSRLANRWRLDADNDLPTVLWRYLEWLLTSKAGERLQAGLMHDLRGRTLGCWCCEPGQLWTAGDPIQCHAQLAACLVDGLDPVAAMVATWGDRADPNGLLPLPR